MTPPPANILPPPTDLFQQLSLDPHSWETDAADCEATATTWGGGPLLSSHPGVSCFMERGELRQSELIFLGTGTSESIPRVSCLTGPSKTCPVCTKAAEPGNRNRRRNIGILLRHTTPSGTSNILVDAGKLRAIDVVIITHSHADATGGLDCLHDWTNNIQPSIPIYVAERDYEVIKMTHYYLIDTSVVISGAAVSTLQFNVIKDEPFTVHNL